MAGHSYYDDPIVPLRPSRRFLRRERLRSLLIIGAACALASLAFEGYIILFGTLLFLVIAAALFGVLTLACFAVALGTAAALSDEPDQAQPPPPPRT